MALHDPDPAVALDAARLYVESLEALARKPSPVACFDDMTEDVPRLRAVHCTDTSPDRDGEACILLDKMQVDVLRLRAQKLVEQGDKLALDAKGTRALFDEGGRAYSEIFREHCQARLADQRPLATTPAVCAEMAYNSARAFRAAHLLAKAIVAYRALLLFDDRAKAGSPLAVKAVYELGQSYRALALYEQAAAHLERYAAMNPRAYDADRAITDAVVLRLGLGDDAQATKDVASFTRTWGTTKRAEAAQLVFALARHHVERKAWSKANTVLVGSLAMLDRGPVDLTIRAHALLARIAIESNDPARATTEFAKVRAMWSDPAAAQLAIRHGWPGEDEQQISKRVATCALAVGEAMWNAAEDQRVAEVEPLKLPPFTGPAERSAIMAYTQTKVRPWFEKKRSAIEKAEAEYVRILDIKPYPPPTWVIAAGAAVGSMWSDFADDFVRVPIPDAWRRSPALYGAYYDALDQMSEPIKAGRAKPAMKKCLELAVRFQVDDARTRVCDAWLAKTYKAEHHLLDEIIPSFRGTGLEARALAAPVGP